jgi:hypothetical protein
MLNTCRVLHSVIHSQTPAVPALAGISNGKLGAKLDKAPLGRDRG